MTTQTYRKFQTLESPRTAKAKWRRVEAFFDAITDFLGYYTRPGYSTYPGQQLRDQTSRDPGDRAAMTALRAGLPLL